MILFIIGIIGFILAGLGSIKNSNKMAIIGVIFIIISLTGLMWEIEKWAINPRPVVIEESSQESWPSRLY